ncbi:YcfL family protein [Shewanella acanthi]|uniref:YcfL family protein n=1 Tax=Shewanella acanthi TaxID=2864212 RepID=UPI001C65F618|nr:YcfL family protein [Shewanella acanthi]QYJ77587.1 YcfL family protein [Shewanella acanthi]
MKPMKCGLLLSLALASVFSLSACVHNTAGVWINSQGESGIDSGGFARNIALEGITTRRVGDLLQGSTLLINKASGDMRVQYKFTWYDANGLTVEESSTSWQSVKLHGKQQLQISAVAPNAEAIKFEVYVRETLSN